MDYDDFPDIPLDNFGAETNVAAAPAEEPKTAPDANATGSEEATAGQPDATEDNSKAESGTSEQAANEESQTPPSGEDNTQQSADASADASAQQTTGRPEKQDRLQNRFDDLTRKVYEKDAIIQQLEAQVAQNQAMRGIQPLQPDENGNIDPQALQDHIARTAQAQAQAQIAQVNNRLEREQIAQRLDSEGNQIESKYKEYFDADPVHAENIKALVEERVNDNLYNTNGLKSISPMKIAERYFKGVEAASKKAQVQTQQNLDEIKADSAVTPSGTAPAVDPDSIEALEAKVANIQF